MLIGREQEIAFLKKAVERDEAQFVAVYGRYRVGKTSLIQEALKGRFTFQHAGVCRGTREEQLAAFSKSLTDAGLMANSSAPRNWFEAFQLLKQLISQSTQRKKIIFLDELSWMDTAKADMMRALEHFWNAWASARHDLVLIVCSSATSWMRQKVIHNQSRLYHRLTGQMRVKPFTLVQCKSYVAQRNLAFSDTQIMELYMAVGGIPFYWELMQKGLSVAQTMDALFFAEEAPLRAEYDDLFAATFKRPGDYLKIVHALAGEKKGRTRNEIIAATGLTGSGVFSEKLEDLESCGFIREYHAFGKKSKDSLYQLMDPLVLFFHHFLHVSPGDTKFWSHQSHTPAMDTWASLAFERLCLLHVDQIKAKLGISGVLTDVASFVCKQDPENGISGSQFDLVIRRADHTVNLLEMKYASGRYLISQSVSEEVRLKTDDFIRATKTRDAIRLTMVTPHGLEWNAYAGEISSQIAMEDLMRDT